MRRTSVGETRIASLGRAALGVALALSTTLTGFPAGVRHAAGDSATPFRVLGQLEVPAGTANNQSIIGVDSERRLLYVYHNAPGGSLIVTYDLRPEVPTIHSARPAPTTVGNVAPGPLTTTFDHGRKRLFVLGFDQKQVAHIDMVPTEGNTEAPQVWPITERLPGFFAGGITYSAADDRIYLVGEQAVVQAAVSSAFTFGSKLVGGPAMVAALDPRDGKLLWARPIPECRFPLYTFSVGTLIARSSPRLPTPKLFVPCTSSAGLISGARGNTPQQSGVAALTIDPRATMSDAAAFDVDFHPISGAYYDGSSPGIGVYDHGADRLFLQSVAPKTPGAWVYDAHVNGWVGAISAPYSSAYYGAVNERSGHYYMGGVVGGESGTEGFLLVTNGRSRKPRNGLVAGRALSPLTAMAVDPVTDRVFYSKNGTGTEVLVVQDTSPVDDGTDERVDYDTQTDDIADSPSSYVSFTGDGSAFAAKVTNVGDTASVNGSLGINAVPQASRSLVIGRVPTVSLQTAGAAAAAEAAGIDTSTSQPLRETEQAPKWPYGMETCLDGGGGVDNPPDETPISSAAVTCDLERYDASGTARYGKAAEGGVSVAQARAESTVDRTVREGLVTRSQATASGVHVDLAAHGSLHIGKVSAVATSRAHGQSGKATSTWSRSIEDVVAKDATGRVVLESRGCTTATTHDGRTVREEGSSKTCADLAEAVRKALQVTVRLLFPAAEVVATPKGAFAGVGQTDADQARETTVNDQGRLLDLDSITRRPVPAVQLDVYHDSVERSRHIVQLAAVETASVFTVNRSLDDPDCATGGCILGGSDTASGTTALESAGTETTGTAAALVEGPLAVDVPSSGLSSSGNGAAQGQSRPSRTLLIGNVIGRRSLGDGFLMASFLVLATGAALGVSRRRRLGDLLGAKG